MDGLRASHYAASTISSQALHHAAAMTTSGTDKCLRADPFAWCDNCSENM